VAGGCASGCAIAPTPLYLGAGLSSASTRRRGGRGVRRVHLGSREAGAVSSAADPDRRLRAYWAAWLVDDQREASGRRTCCLRLRAADRAAEDQRQPVANLIASTSGTDSDWVVKVIDVYPTKSPAQPAMGGIS
jgi:predicted acyl esterase